MTITVYESGNKLFAADNGKAIAPKGEDGPTTVTTANAPATAPDDAWHDCEYGEPSEEATEADKDAALRKFGVEVTNE